MRRAAALSFVSGLALLGPAAAEAPVPAWPEMTLRLSTHSGPRPLDLTLTASFLDLKADEMRACLITEERTYKSPGGIFVTSKREFPCVEGSEEVRIPRSFERKVTLTEPGTYSFRVALENKQGKRRVSTSQEVVVYRSHREFSVVVEGVNKAAASPPIE